MANWYDKYLSIYEKSPEEIPDSVFLWIQHFNRLELCVRGMVFAFKTALARKVDIRTDIRRGENESMFFIKGTR
jgi:hypothetical protein